MSAIPPLLEGKQTLGELPENEAHDPNRRFRLLQRRHQRGRFEDFRLQLSAIVRSPYPMSLIAAVWPVWPGRRTIRSSSLYWRVL